MYLYALEQKAICIVLPRDEENLVLLYMFKNYQKQKCGWLFLTTWQENTDDQLPFGKLIWSKLLWEALDAWCTTSSVDDCIYLDDKEEASCKYTEPESHIVIVSLKGNWNSWAFSVSRPVDDWCRVRWNQWAEVCLTRSILILPSFHAYSLCILPFPDGRHAIPLLLVS